MSDSTNHDLYTPLAGRPTATTLTVRELLARVESGKIRVPRFQRSLRWKSNHVVELFDSILRGYPVGALLFWVRQAEADEALPVGGARISVPAVPDAWWLVDGQQRTTALAAALLDLDQASDRRWSVRFDPESGTVLAGPPKVGEQGRHVPLSILGDLRRLGRWLRDATLTEGLIDRVEEAQQRILDYTIPVYVMETSDESALRGVFARMNSTGVRMRREEVFHALVGSRGDGTSLDLGTLQRACDVDDFGQPERVEVMKAVLSMSGIDPMRNVEDLGSESLARLEDALSTDSAAEALRRTVRFLQEVAGIPHVSLIPYPAVFAIVARWFHTFPETGAVYESLLARWLWRGVVTQTHVRAEVSKLRQQVRMVEEGDLDGSIRRLEKALGSLPVTPWMLQKFHLSNARSRVEMLALWELGPRYPGQEGRVSLAALVSSGTIAREVYAAVEVNRLSEAGRDQAKTAANRIILDTVHTGLQATLRRWLEGGYDEVLRTHAIDEPTAQALLDGDPSTFLALRFATIERLVRDFLARRTEFDEPDARPVTAYTEDTGQS